MEKLKILVFSKLHKPLYRFLEHFVIELSKHAHVQIWDKDGEIQYILKILKEKGFIPDFILHYDFAYDYSLAPRINGLSDTKIPKGVYYFDLQVQTEERKEFVYQNRIDLIFSPYKDYFFNTYPELKDKFRWLPYSNNPQIFKDWNLHKDIDFLLMGSLLFDWYPFREKIIKEMGSVKGFVYHKHYAEVDSKDEETFTGEKYAKEINRAKIFFTCGSKYNFVVKKYFEVPACNTLLIAKGNKDLKELGFVDGENFVECNDYNFYDLGMYYLKNQVERNRIAMNGYNLVHSRHTDRVRVKEFLDTIKGYTNSTGSMRLRRF